MIDFTDRELKILHHLVATEMNGFCGDLGYSELNGIIQKILTEQEVKEKEKEKP